MPTLNAIIVVTISKCMSFILFVLQYFDYRYQIARETSSKSPPSTLTQTATAWSINVCLHAHLEIVGLQSLMLGQVLAFEVQKKFKWRNLFRSYIWHHWVTACINPAGCVSNVCDSLIHTMSVSHRYQQYCAKSMCLKHCLPSYTKTMGSIGHGLCHFTMQWWKSSWNNIQSDETLQLYFNSFGIDKLAYFQPCS